MTTPSPRPRRTRAPRRPGGRRGLRNRTPRSLGYEGQPKTWSKDREARWFARTRGLAGHRRASGQPIAVIGQPESPLVVAADEVGPAVADVRHQRVAPGDEVPPAPLLTVRQPLAALAAADVGHPVA